MAEALMGKADPVFHDTGLILPEELSLEEWREILTRVTALHRAATWWLGDLMLKGEEMFGEEVFQYIDPENYSETTVYFALRVAREFPPPRRHPELLWSHHQEALPLEGIEREKILNAAAEGKWSTSKLRKEVKLRRLELQATDPVAFNRAAQLAYVEWQTFARGLRGWASDYTFLADDVQEFASRVERKLKAVLREPPRRQEIGEGNAEETDQEETGERLDSDSTVNGEPPAL